MHFQRLLINNYDMSKFNTILESHLNTTSLSRIRIKHDPKNEKDERGEYVGYVLEEDGAGGIVAIVPQLGPETMELGAGEFEIDQPGSCGEVDPLSSFKKHVVKFLMVRGYHEKVSEYMETIINSSCIIELEKLVKGCGCDTTAVLDLYRDFVVNE